MDAHYDFLAFIERLESLRREKKLTPDVYATEGGGANVAQGGAGGPSITTVGHPITVSTQAPSTKIETKTEASATKS